MSKSTGGDVHMTTMNYYEYEEGYECLSLLRISVGRSVLASANFLCTRPALDTSSCVRKITHCVS